MKVLVLGWNGFIGKNLYNRLEEYGHQVHGFVDDVRDFKSWRSINYRPEVIINLASLTDPKDVKNNPTKTITTNAVGTYNALEYCWRHNIKYIHVSTIRTLDKFVDPDHPLITYIEGKKCAEIMCKSYYEKEYVECSIARLSSVYGPLTSIDDGRVIPTFIKKALKNETITVFDGIQLDTFLYVDDCCDVLNFMCENNYPLDNNILTGEMISIFDLAEMIIDLSGSKSIIAVSLTTNQIQSRNLGLKGLDTYTPLKEGLIKTIDYFRSII